MARRWNTQDSDSSDLMLDTICNVFGSIILMSILVVLQTQAGAARVTGMAEEAAVAALDIREVQSKVRETESQILGLRLRRDAVGTHLSRVVSPHTAELLKRREGFIRATSDAERQLKATTDDSERVAKELAKVGADARDHDLEGQRKANEIESLKRRLEQARNISKAEVRLPLRHDSRAPTQSIYVVEGDRIYKYPNQCDREPFLGGKGERVTPKTNSGCRIANPQELSQYVSGLGTEPTRHFVTFFVLATTQSFESFQVVRKEAANRGFECGYGPYSAKMGLVLFPGKAPVE